MDTPRDIILKHQEKKDKRKARTFSTLALLIILLGLWLPLIAGTIIEPEKVNQAVLIQFEEKVFERAKLEAKAAAKRSSTKKSEAKAAEKPIETPTVEAPAPEPMPETTKPVEAKPEPRKTLTPVQTVRDAPTRPNALSAPSKNPSFALMKTQISENALVQEVSEEVMEVTEEVPSQELAEMASFFKNKKPAGGTGGGSGDQNTQSDGGEAEFGSADSGDSNLDGHGNEGEFGSGSDFDGEGLLTRKVVKRVNLADVIKQSGKIAIDLCVNNDGKVIYIKADPNRSTIKDRSILKLAEAKVSQYRYEKDYTVSAQQCGRFTIVLNIEEEK